MDTIVVTAPEHRYFPPKSLKIFLAGGICKCDLWQQEIIKKFLNESHDLSSDYNDIYLLNPRRTDWLDNPGEAQRQIEWEFDMIENCDVFTMYFAGGESDQPICMYELGRNIQRMKERFPTTWVDRIIITCDESYKRINDVVIQTKLATDNLIKVNCGDTFLNTVNKHYNAINENLKYIYNE